MRKRKLRDAKLALADGRVVRIDVDKSAYHQQSQNEIGGDKPCYRQLSGKFKLAQVLIGLLPSSLSLGRNQCWINISSLQYQNPGGVGQRIGRYVEVDAPTSQVRHANRHNPIKS